MNFIVERTPLFTLVLIRISGLLVAAPLFSNSMINAKVKVFFSFALAALLTSLLSASAHKATALDWIGAAACEFGVGLILGFGARIAFSAASMAGELMGLQMGIGQAALYDPNSEQQVSPLEQFYSAAFLGVFIAIDGHHHILRALKESFVLLPIERTSTFHIPIDVLIVQTTRMLACGCRMAAPVVAPLLLLSIAVALVSRAYPQMSVYSLSYGVSILAGMFLLAASVPGMRIMAEETVRDMDRLAIDLLHAIGTLPFGGFAHG